MNKMEICFVLEARQETCAIIQGIFITVDSIERRPSSHSLENLEGMSASS